MAALAVVVPGPSGVAAAPVSKATQRAGERTHATVPTDVVPTKLRAKRIDGPRGDRELSLKRIAAELSPSATRGWI